MPPSQFDISWEDIRDVKVALPPLGEQRRIADFLDDQVARIDNIIAARRTQAECIESAWSIDVSQALHRVENPPVELRRFLNRPPDYGANAAADSDDPSWPRFIRTTDVTSDGDLKAETFRSLDPKIAADFMLVDGDVLVTRSGATVGKSFIYNESWGPAAFAGYLIRISSDRSLLEPEWIKFFTETPEYWAQISQSTIQSTIQNVNAAKYASLMIPRPDLTDQRKVIKKLVATRRDGKDLIEGLLRSIKLFEEMKRSLITSAVTGEFDVSTADGSRVPV